VIVGLGLAGVEIVRLLAGLGGQTTLPLAILRTLARQAFRLLGGLRHLLLLS